MTPGKRVLGWRVRQIDEFCVPPLYAIPLRGNSRMWQWTEVPQHGLIFSCASAFRLLKMIRERCVEFRKAGVDISWDANDLRVYRVTRRAKPKPAATEPSDAEVEKLATRLAQVEVNASGRECKVIYVGTSWRAVARAAWNLGVRVRP